VEPNAQLASVEVGPTLQYMERTAGTEQVAWGERTMSSLGSVTATARLQPKRQPSGKLLPRVRVSAWYNAGTMRSQEPAMCVEPT